MERSTHLLLDFRSCYTTVSERGAEFLGRKNRHLISAFPGIFLGKAFYESSRIVKQVELNLFTPSLQILVSFIGHVATNGTTS